MDRSERERRPARSTMERLLRDAERLARLGSWTMDLGTGAAEWSDELFRIHGIPPQSVSPGVEMLLDHVDPEDREAVAALLRSVVEAPRSVSERGVEIEYRARRTNGELRDVRALGRVERDANGTPTRWIGTAQDVTEQRLTERELRAHYAVSQALRDWESFEEGVMGLLRRLGTALEFPFGALWTWDADRDALTCRAFWSAPADADGPTAFELVTREVACGPGDGVPGQAWEQRRPIIVGDIYAHPQFARAEEARALGLRSGLAFPAVGPDGPLAVLSFYSRDRRAPTTRLERTLTGIGRDLGRFLARRRADLEPRPLSPRELEVLRLAAEGVSGPAIAERLFVSPSTVKTHFEHIYDKLGVGDRAAAVAQALRTGLIV
jgi:PAS domain S-box-containing protein